MVACARCLTSLRHVTSTLPGSVPTMQARRAIRTEEHSYSHGRDHHALQIAAKGFDRYQEDYAGAARAGHDRADNSDRGAAMGWHDEELHDNAPRKDRRRGLVIALALIRCATVRTAGAYAYWTYHFGPGSTQTSVQSQAQPAQQAVRGAPPAVAANGAVGGYIVQVSARRSKADAQASFLSLQSKFPRQLGGRTAIFQRADLSARRGFTIAPWWGRSRRPARPTSSAAASRPLAASALSSVTDRKSCQPPKCVFCLHPQDQQWPLLARVTNAPSRICAARAAAALPRTRCRACRPSRIPVRCRSWSPDCRPGRG